MSEESKIGKTAADLRNEFDQLYSVPPPSSSAAGEIENLLVIRMAQSLYAIRLAEITGLESKRKIVAVPGPISEMLGIAGVRGKFVSVYNLTALVGCSSDVTERHWMVLCGGEDQIGLGFVEFMGYLRVPGAQIYEGSREKDAGDHIEAMARMGETTYAVLSVPSLLKRIRARCADYRMSSQQH